MGDSRMKKLFVNRRTLKVLNAENLRLKSENIELTDDLQRLEARCEEHDEAIGRLQDKLDVKDGVLTQQGISLDIKDALLEDRDKEIRQLQGQIEALQKRQGVLEHREALAFQKLAIMDEQTEPIREVCRILGGVSS